jgi:cellulose synthase/poly-beta-1,6-N-acetylglucosamine synthase-like glycosyltransferase
MTEQSEPLQIRLRGVLVNPNARKMLPEPIARRFHVAPIRFEHNELVVAVTNLFQRAELRELAGACRYPVHPIQCTYVEIRQLIDRLYGRQGTTPQPLSISQTLFALGYLEEQELELAENLKPEPAEALSAAFSRRGLVPDLGVLEAIGLQLNLPHIQPDNVRPSVELAPLISWELAQEFRAIPLWWIRGLLVVGVPEDCSMERVDDLVELLDVPIRVVLCTTQSWERAARQLYLRGHDQEDDIQLAAARWLLKRGDITPLHFETAQTIYEQTQRDLASILVTEGIVSPKVWALAVADITRTEAEPGVNTIPEPDSDLLHVIPSAIARRFTAIPLRREAHTLVLGMGNPDPVIVRLFERIAGTVIKPYILELPVVNDLLDRCYGTQQPVSSPITPRLGEILLEMGLITCDQLEKALEQSTNRGILLGAQLIRNGHLDEMNVVEALSIQHNIPYAGLDYARFNKELIQDLPAKLLFTHTMIPLVNNPSSVWVAVDDPLDAKGLLEIERITNRTAWPILASTSVIQATLERLLGSRYQAKTDPVAAAFLEKLIRTGCLTQIGASRALEDYTRRGGGLDEAVVQVSASTPRELSLCMAGILDIQFEDLHLREETVQLIDPLGKVVEKTMTRDPVDHDAARFVNYATAERLFALPVGFLGNKVRIAVADPLFETTMREMEGLIGQPVQPVLAVRQDLEEAIQRTLGRQNLGSALLLAGVITRHQLNDALDYAQRTGVRLGRALMDRGYITGEQLAEFLAQQAGMTFTRLPEIDIDEQVARLVDPFLARKFGVLPIQADEKQITAAIIDPLDSEALAWARETLHRPLNLVLVSERDMDNALQQVYREDYLSHSIYELLERTPEDSAFKVLNLGQWISLVLFIIGSAVWLFYNHNSYLVVLNSIFTVFYLVFSAYRLYLVYRALNRNLEVRVLPEEISRLEERDLPVYTILVPVYREADVLPDLLDALKRLDYPKTKLDIKVLFEEDDKQTIAAFHDWNPPAHFHGIVVPYGQPKTKPKACNFGLIHARGEYIVIFDAEDLPDADQLKKIIVAFSKVSPDVVCIQSKLNYYNSNQNLLTRWFTVEYSMWFDLFLPGLEAAGAPIPLGGTSNHFHTAALVDVGAWDPHNVTEDADLGVRLYKRGYKTAIVDSTTYEEANSQIYNWIRQRSRWIKGYMQTWLVHMRNPLCLVKEMGWKGFFGFHFTVGGTFFAALLNPIYWLLTTLWFWKELPIIKVIFPSTVYYLGALCLFVGNFAFTYMSVAGALRRGYYEMVKHALLSPLYWGLASIAAWKGFLQLLTKPHFWEKTVHGLYESEIDLEPDSENQPSDV